LFLPIIDGVLLFLDPYSTSPTSGEKRQQGLSFTRFVVVVVVVQ
jgi:hypothetical protein